MINASGGGTDGSPAGSLDHRPDSLDPRPDPLEHRPRFTELRGTALGSEQLGAPSLQVRALDVIAAQRYRRLELRDSGRQVTGPHQ